MCLLVIHTCQDFSGEDKASGIKFCTVIQGRPGKGVSHFGEICSPRCTKSDESTRGGKYCRLMPVPSADSALAVSGKDLCLSAILALGICGYTADPVDGRTCFSG